MDAWKDFTCWTPYVGHVNNLLQCCFHLGFAGNQGTDDS